MEFSVFKSIIEGELRPDSEKNQKNPYSFTKDIRAELKSPGTIQEFEIGLAVHVALFLPSGQYERNYFANNPGFIDFISQKELKGNVFEPEIKITQPHPINAFTEFYFYLIKNEATRNFYVFKFLISRIEIEGEKRAFLFHVLKKIRSFINSGLQNYKAASKKNFTEGDEPDSLSDRCVIENTKYIYKILTLNLIRLYFEIARSFPILIGDNGRSVLELLGGWVDYIDVEKLSEEITPKRSKTDNGNNKTGIEYHSFKYSQTASGKEKIKELYNYLKKNNLIKKTLLKEFRVIFSGEVVDKKVTWIMGIGSLKYFVHLLCVKHKLVDDLSRDHWKVAAKCFILDDEKNKGPFSSKQIKETKFPKKATNLIESAILLLK